jgi:hypothetical protein
VRQIRTYLPWILDRDAKPNEAPSTNSVQFKNALEQLQVDCYILLKREIEFYYPEEVLKAAQHGDKIKEEAVIGVLRGDQSEKFVYAARAFKGCVPSGKYLRQLLQTHLINKSQLDQEIREIVENKLIGWKKEILGELGMNKVNKQGRNFW